MTVGRRFGRLVVTAREGEAVTCICDCGNVIVKRFKNLSCGNTKSCGCLRRVAALARKTKHGMTDSPEYRTWVSMRGRCRDPANANFARYGGRGIKVCARWDESFPAFYADMGPRPPGSSLDRIDNNGNYELGNCRWATSTQQQRNRSDRTEITYYGATHSVTEWAEILGVKRVTLQKRMQRGWPPEKILTVHDHRFRKEYQCA